MPKKIYEENSNLMSIEEVWENLADFCNRRVEDNKNCDEYPFEVRTRQLSSLNSFIRIINEYHKMNGY